MVKESAEHHLRLGWYLRWGEKIIHLASLIISWEEGHRGKKTSNHTRLAKCKRGHMNIIQFCYMSIRTWRKEGPLRASIAEEDRDMQGDCRENNLARSEDSSYRVGERRVLEEGPKEREPELLQEKESPLNCLKKKLEI